MSCHANVAHSSGSRFPVSLDGVSSLNSFTFPSKKMQIEGPLRDYLSQADSGNLTHRGFCPTCGTPESEARRIFLRSCRHS